MNLHEFAKVNMTAFDSDTILFNMFGESITVNKHSVVDSLWKGTSRDPNYVDVRLFIGDGMIGGSMNTDFGYFSITSFGQNDLYIIQEIDLSQYKDEPDDWYMYLAVNGLNFFLRSYFVILVMPILLVAGIVVFIVKRKLKARKENNS